MELIDRVNNVNESMGEPKIDSRYTLVMAIAKRARDLVDGDPAMVADDVDGRTLSLAVKEMDKEKLGIVTVEPVYETKEETNPLDEVDLSTSVDDEE
jgi:DNA-directed RNA polymerase subunit omega